MIPIVTIATPNYMAQARTLAYSYRAQHPHGRAFLCLVGGKGMALETAPFERVVHAEDLGIPDWEDFTFKYNVVELATALKASVLKFFFAAYGFPKLIYFDADIALYAPLDDLDALLDHHAIILTPNITHPLDNSKKPTEVDIRLVGVYNLGFLALSQSESARACLDWWESRLYDGCWLNSAQGYYVDQAWIDHVPTFFEGVHIWRDEASNVAYWNVSERHFSEQGGHWYINDKPLRFFHFSGYHHDQPTALPAAQTRLSPAALPLALTALYRDYHTQMTATGHDETRQLPYAYHTFANGVPIPPLARRLYWGLPDRRTRFPTPFQVGEESFFAYLNSPYEGRQKKPPYLTNFGAFMYQQHPQVRTFLTDGLGRDRERLLGWLTMDGADYFKVDPAFLAPLRASTPLGKVTQAWRGGGDTSWFQRVADAAKIVLPSPTYRAFQRRLGRRK